MPGTLKHKATHATQDSSSVTKGKDGVKKDEGSDTLTTHLVEYKGEKYNVYPYLDKHPGGRAILEKYRGKDITKAFERIGHSEYAKTTLASHKLEPDATENVKPTFKNHKVDAAFVKRKLFTEEDKNNIHKTFGLLSLLSFAYRYFYVLPTTGGLGFSDGSIFDWCSLAAHFFLTFSSLIFHVVEHRILSNPLIIYEEYRLHAILFTARAIFVSIFGFYQHLLPGNTAKWGLGFLILAIHLAVDYVTKLHGTPGVTAVRVNNDGSIRELKLFFAFYQVLAMSTHIIVDPMLCDLGWNAVVAIQSSAFLMTLKRKSIIRSRTHLFWYSLALFVSMAEIFIVKGTVWYLMVIAMFYLKVKFNLNKYLMWTVFTFAVYYVQSIDTANTLGLSPMSDEL